MEVDPLSGPPRDGGGIDSVERFSVPTALAAVFSSAVWVRDNPGRPGQTHGSAPARPRLTLGPIGGLDAGLLHLGVAILCSTTGYQVPKAFLLRCRGFYRIGQCVRGIWPFIKTSIHHLTTRSHLLVQQPV